ncbi:MAG TPA: RNA polymerase sigma factor [Candidatus Paceibacterota bacterium]|nr:RNA polymerase sigma factor [Candidatus Paceibacterota bacterium]
MNSRHNPEKRFIEAYDAYADAMLRYCYFKISDRHRAEELTEEAFMKAWQYLVKGEDVENMRAFLYRILNNLIIDEYRRKRTSSLDDLEAEGFELSDARAHTDIEEQVEINRLLGIIDQLDGKYREVVILRYVDDLGVREIAEILGEAENTISVRINRAIKQLKKLMKL